MKTLHTVLIIMTCLSLVACSGGGGGGSSEVAGGATPPASPLPEAGTSFSILSSTFLQRSFSLTGLNLATVTQVKLVNGSTEIPLVIDSQNDNSLTASFVSSVSLQAGLASKLLVSSASASSEVILNLSVADESITNAKLASGVDGAKIQAGTISNSHLASGIDASKITVGTLPLARLDVGTAANQIVKLDGNAKLPAVDGSQLQSLSADNVSAGTLSESRMPNTFSSDKTFSGNVIVSGNLSGDKLAFVYGEHQNLIVKNNTATPATKIDISADELVLRNSSNQYILARSINLTADLNVNGANGLYNLVKTNGTWYYFWILSNGTSTISLISDSATTPQLPAGYESSYKARVSSLYYSSNTFQRINQYGYHVDYLNALVLLSNGNSTSYASISLTTMVPPIVNRIYLSGHCYATAATDQYGYISNDGSNGSVNCLSWGSHLSSFSDSFPISTQTLWYAVNTSSGGFFIRLRGYDILK